MIKKNLHKSKSKKQKVDDVTSKEIANRIENDFENENILLQQRGLVQ